ncbi:hypothetical protein AWE51_01990 [Aquimarina aggregata]|uniref:Uncharacterized protein n=2 Tax=Flavobacteriaceae TaxID=49546 RepID=A0A163CB34_9FLAO|nr:hypothetical protein AWE51_01990 [Aquimarina aggregata]RKM97647.1 hypothetical protein D7033_13765 [Aquimarina sp. AD10]
MGVSFFSLACVDKKAEEEKKKAAEAELNKQVEAVEQEIDKDFESLEKEAKEIDDALNELDNL